MELNYPIITVAGKEIVLSPLETKVLSYLVRNKGRALAVHQILDAVWGGSFPSEAAARAVIISLRKKIGKSTIKNIWGFGYVIY